MLKILNITVFVHNRNINVDIYKYISLHLKLFFSEMIFKKVIQSCGYRNHFVKFNIHEAIIKNLVQL